MTWGVSLEAVLANCDEFGDCLRWRGRVNHGSPQMWGPLPEKPCIQVRRLVFEMSSGTPIPKGRNPVMKCRDSRCLCFAHMQLMTPRQIGQLAAREGRFSTPYRCAAIAAGARKRGKLSLEIVREIRASDEPGPAVAKRLGIHRSLVNRIRRGQAWREVAQGASVFNLA